MIDQDKARDIDGVELRLTVWTHGAAGWHARIVAPDASEHEFASPFELVRYFAGSATLPATNPGKGLR